jgi:hypothetical protein
MPRIEEVESAIKARDRAKCPAAYDKLTATCNSCHRHSASPVLQAADASGVAVSGKISEIAAIPTKRSYPGVTENSRPT